METLRPRSHSPHIHHNFHQAHGPRSPGSPRKVEPRIDATTVSFPYVDIEKIKREVSDSAQKHQSSAAMSMPAPPPLVSPSNMYSGPPPPYSYPSSNASSVVGVPGLISPPESRRTSDDDKDLPLPRQSLPSIRETFGQDQALLYASGQPHATQQPSQISNLAPVQTPTTPIPRSHPEAVLSGPRNPYATGLSAPYSFEVPEQRARPMYHPGSQSEDPARPLRIITHETDARPSHPGSVPSPSSSSRPNSLLLQHQNPSPIYSSAPQHSASIPSQTIYYASQPTYSYPPSSSGAVSYQNPYSQAPSWRSEGVDPGRSDEMRKASSKRSPPNNGQHYGESVKRHLEIFDLETSLNEIAEGSSRALEFSRHFGACAHQNQRSGLLPSSLPTLQECDDMIRRQNAVMDSMTRIREVILAQQRALAEQRSRDEAHKAPSDYGEDANAYSEKVDGSGGFAGADPKKRRGRNAPPGRCHSCNRAETPEWRRGPDGARTLCNACGLHYAKLTRKMGSKAPISSSNLRPKENASGSP